MSRFKPMSSTENAPRYLVYLAYLFLALVWGTGWYAIRLCVSDGGYSVFGGAALRYTLASIAILALIPFFPRAFGQVRRKNIGWLVLAGLVNALAMGLLYWGEKSVSGGLAAVLVATSPFMAAAISFFTRTERVSLYTVVGFALALCGVAVIFAERLVVSPSHLVAMASVLGSALCFAIVNFIIKLRAREVTPLQSSAVFFVSMGAVFWLASPAEGAFVAWPPPEAPTFALLYLAIGCSAFAFPAFCYLLRHSSLMFASTLAFVHPVVAMVTDCLFEKNFVLTMSAYGGISIVLLGVILSMLSNANKAQPVLASNVSSDGEALKEPIGVLTGESIEQRPQAA